MQALSSVSNIRSVSVARAASTKSAKVSAAAPRMVVKASAEKKVAMATASVSAAALAIAATPEVANAGALALDWLPAEGAGGNLSDGQVYLALFAVQIVGALAARLGSAMYKN